MQEITLIAEMKLLLSCGGGCLRITKVTIPPGQTVPAKKSRVMSYAGRPENVTPVKWKGDNYYILDKELYPATKQ